MKAQTKQARGNVPQALGLETVRKDGYRFGCRGSRALDAQQQQQHGHVARRGAERTLNESRSDIVTIEYDAGWRRVKNLSPGFGPDGRARRDDSVDGAPAGPRRRMVHGRPERKPASVNKTMNKPGPGNALAGCRPRLPGARE